MSRKIIIAFEGIEGSGKSLHIKNISNYLKKKKISFIKLREPGGSKNSEIIRKLVLSNKSNFDVKTDLLLYLAARNENVVNLIKKNYKKKVFLIDRFTDSTLAYQHYGMGIQKSIINSINNFVLINIKVNFTFLHLVSKKNLKKRLHKRQKLNRYDKFKLSFYNKVQKGYLKIYKSNKKKYQTINSDNSIIKNKALIISKINDLLKI
tara:strand:- start:3630 stop:4250 length:621 start_codon:yes stop_codon:yes gene_type:complete